MTGLVSSKGFAHPRVRSEVRIGPNSVLQTLRAVEESQGPAVRQRLVDRCGLPAAWPEGLIPESWFVRLVAAVRSELATEAETILRTSGRYTADYVAAHRIPRLAKGLLSILPDPWAMRLLLRLFRAHAWTFAGASNFDYAPGERPRTFILTLDDCPTCRRVADGPGGAYYEAAFEGLLRIAARAVRVREITCRRAGADACRFEAQF